jgi:hypothetical protein
MAFEAFTSMCPVPLIKSFTTTSKDHEHVYVLSNQNYLPERAVNTIPRRLMIHKKLKVDAVNN